MPDQALTVADVARVCHETNRALQAVTGDPAPSPEWAEAEQWQRDSAIDGVQHALNGASPAEQHEAWCDFKRADGWTYGPVKDAAAKTHPCLVDYAQLDAGQKAKDAAFVAVVAALAPYAAEAQAHV
jgi:hypothetical protein